MIKITIQGKNHDQDQLAWENGKELKSENEIQRIYDEISFPMNKNGFLWDDREKAKLLGNINFMFIYHPEKDDIGRTRVAKILWDYKSDQSEIQKTIELAGLDYERFLRICDEAKVKKSKQSNKNTIIGGAVGLLVGAIATDTAIKAIALGAIGAIIGNIATKIKG